jgi:hypothetical protein
MSNSRQLDKCDDENDDDDDGNQLADFNTIVDLNHTWLSRSRYGFHCSRLPSSMSLFVLLEELF